MSSGLFHQAFLSLRLNFRDLFQAKTFLFYKNQQMSWEVIEFCTLNTLQKKYWSFSLLASYLQHKLCVLHETGPMALGQKKLIITFSGKFFSKINEAGRLYHFFLLLQIRMRVFIFSSQGVMRHFFITISLFSIYVCG